MDNNLKIYQDENGSFIFVENEVVLKSACLDSPRARRVKEIAIICAELEDVLFWLNQVLEMVNNAPNQITYESDEAKRFTRQTRAFFISACITYFKFFTHGHGMAVKLNASDIYNYEQLEMHKNIERLRHKLYAHVDVSEDFTHDLFALWDVDHKRTPSIAPFLRRLNHFSAERLEQFINLVSYLNEHLSEQYRKAGQALMDDEFGSGRHFQKNG